MFNSKALLAITLVALISTVSASPMQQRSAKATTTVTVCTDANAVSGCVGIPVVSDDCVNLTGGLSFLNQEISAAIVPGGFVCTFFEDAACIASGTGNSNQNSEVVLTQGTWVFSSVPGLSGTENFNDLTSSFVCSPL
ncbi:hypothetical protein FB45DRAFT_941252 [Roridomyces roridus]|uniref:Uncharacterized protein n=1 Tax=Roridomyces roridus TaxID=1738132 RepID=A0AAD7B698_9AGAR|nr:hypothetical protein FB45DRAFT_941252 [Roridomyces roridus]